MEINQYLRKIPIFSQIDDAQIEEIKNITKERFYKKGSIIIVEGDMGDAVFIIKTGKVKIYKTADDGREIILDIKDDTNIFAEVTLFNQGRNPATVQAIEDCYIYCISNRDVENLIKNNPDISLEIIKMLNRRLIDAQKKIKIMALNDTYVRTAQTLLKLCEKYGKKIEKAIELELTITREEIASLVGASRETISRAISQFIKEDAIEIVGRKIVIKDKNKLEEWVQK